MFGKTTGHRYSQLPQSKKDQLSKGFRSINTKAGILPRHSTRFYSLEIANQDQLDRLEDYIIQHDLAAADYTNEGIFPKYLVVPIEDKLNSSDLLRLYTTTRYQRANIQDTQFAEILGDQCKDTTCAPVKGFYALSAATFELIREAIGGNASEVMKNVKWVTL